jgi:N-carbamoyl-L-amino-acid hydrolase
LFLAFRVIQKSLSSFFKKSINMLTRLLFVALVIFSNSLYPQEGIKINQDRLEKTLFELAKYGMKDNGETSRVAFSDADIEGRAYVMDLMKSAGLEVSIDYAGNIIGKRKGKAAGKKPIALGSHIDMVPDGGNYDGIVGSLAAIEVAMTLKEQGIATEHPLEIIIFPNEEGGVMGSRALAGTLKPEALDVKNSTGYTMGQGIDRIGGDASRVMEVRREKGSLAAFLELHIEQGALLDESGKDIGVVEGIVGIHWWDVEVKGNANHAGTTPMNLRQDALLAAARFVISVNEVALAHPGRHVATVGRIHAEPGAPNVIPGRVLLSLEIRDLSTEKMEMLFREIEQRAMDIADNSGTTFKFQQIDATGSPALTDERIRKVIAEVSGSLGLTHQSMQSGAGHDAQEMALIAPAGMIFVPSKGGISHAPAEFTSAADMANGANVLLHTLLRLDKEFK